MKMPMPRLKLDSNIFKKTHYHSMPNIRRKIIIIINVAGQQHFKRKQLSTFIRKTRSSVPKIRMYLGEKSVYLLHEFVKNLVIFYFLNTF